MAPPETSTSGGPFPDRENAISVPSADVTVPVSIPASDDMLAITDVTVSLRRGPTA